MIHLSLKETCKLNAYGYAKTKSKDTTEKIWSLANNWQNLITSKKKNNKKIVLSLRIHKMTASEEASKILYKITMPYLAVTLKTKI